VYSGTGGAVPVAVVAGITLEVIMLGIGLGLVVIGVLGLLGKLRWPAVRGRRAAFSLAGLFEMFHGHSMHVGSALVLLGAWYGCIATVIASTWF